MSLFLILQYITISLIFIITAHYSWYFLKTNLTIPKTKDLIKKPTEVYKDIYGTINKKNNPENMKDELRNYIDTIKNNDNTSSFDNTSTFDNTSSFDNNIQNFSNGTTSDNFLNWDNERNDEEEITLNLSQTIK